MGSHWSILSRAVTGVDTSFGRSWGFWSEDLLISTSGVDWVSLKPGPSSILAPVLGCPWNSISSLIPTCFCNKSCLFDLASVGLYSSNWNKWQGQPLFLMVWLPLLENRQGMLQELLGCSSHPSSGGERPTPQLRRWGDNTTLRRWGVNTIVQEVREQHHSSGGEGTTPQPRRWGDNITAQEVREHHPGGEEVRRHTTTQEVRRHTTAQKGGGTTPQQRRWGDNTTKSVRGDIPLWFHKPSGCLNFYGIFA